MSLLIHETLRLKSEFSFVAPIHFIQKQWGEVDKISSKFILCDHVCNSHDHSILQSIDITRRNLMLMTRGFKGLINEVSVLSVLTRQDKRRQKFCLYHTEKKHYKKDNATYVTYKSPRK